MLKTITFVAALAIGVSSGAFADQADYVFANGKVYTVNEKQPWAEAVAVKGNKIVYVGDAAGAKAFVGEGTQVIDTTGKTVMPGFISAHDHLIASNWTTAGVNLFDAKSKEGYLKLIKEYADAHPDEKVVKGIGWNVENLGGVAPLLEPYEGKDTKGSFNVKPEVTREIILLANKAGLDVMIHTDGDASSRAAVDAIEATFKSDHKDNRNALHHAIWVHPDDQKRIIDMKIPINSTPSFSTDWAGQGEQYPQLLG